MGLLSEFKKFAMRGNVVDMAVGVVIGGAFGLIVTEIVGTKNRQCSAMQAKKIQ